MFSVFYKQVRIVNARNKQLYWINQSEIWRQRHQPRAPGSVLPEMHGDETAGQGRQYSQESEF